MKNQFANVLNGSPGQQRIPMFGVPPAQPDALTGDFQ
jgi:hypothetical protein